jgi:hypothetical protein
MCVIPVMGGGGCGCGGGTCACIGECPMSDARRSSSSTVWWPSSNGSPSSTSLVLSILSNHAWPPTTSATTLGRDQGPSTNVPSALTSTTCCRGSPRDRPPARRGASGRESITSTCGFITIPLLSRNLAATKAAPFHFAWLARLPAAGVHMARAMWQK